MELATMTCFTIQPNTNKKGKWPGKPVHFHAHLALEPKCSFMLILQLENARRPAHERLDPRHLGMAQIVQLGEFDDPNSSRLHGCVFTAQIRQFVGEVLACDRPECRRFSDTLRPFENQQQSAFAPGWKIRATAEMSQCDPTARE
jgi:hypothetical protein